MFNRSAILKAAWTIARRRMARLGDTMRNAIRAGLTMAWADAKDAAKVARMVAVQMAQDFARKDRSPESLRDEVARLEAVDFHTWTDRAQLAELRRALAA